MITIRHSMNEEDLAAAMQMLGRAFTRAGLDLDSMEVRFEFAEDKLSSFSFSNTELVLKKALEQPLLDSGLALRSTPWERANPNAPWYRRHEQKQRRNFR